MVMHQTFNLKNRDRYPAPLPIFMKKIMMTLMGALVSATIVTAQPAPPAKHPKNQPVPADIFTEADTDGNGELSLGEFTVLVENGRKQREQAKPPQEKNPPAKNGRRPVPVKPLSTEAVISQ